MRAFSFAKLVGAASPDGWSQVHVFEPSPGKTRQRGRLVLIVSLRIKEQPSEGILDLAAFGKEVLQRIHEQYYGGEFGANVLGHLRSSVAAVASEFPQMFVEAVAGVLVPTSLPGRTGIFYLVSVGGGSCFVWRDGGLYRISGPEGERDVVRAVSGFVESGDLLVLGTGDFFRLVATRTLQSALAAGDPVEVVSILAPQVHGSEGNSGVAAAVVRVTRDEGVAEEGLDSAEIIEEAAAAPAAKDEARRLPGSTWAKVVGRSEEKLRLLTGWWRGRRERAGGAPTEIVLRDGGGKRRRLMFSLAVVLLALLLVSVFLGWRKRMANEREQAFLTVWELVDHQFQEAGLLVELNPLRARSLLAEAKRTLGAALADTEPYSAADRERLALRLQEIERMLEQVSGEHRVEEAAVFLDLELVRPGTRGEELDLHGDTLVVLDRTAGVLLRVDVRRKSAEAVGGGSLLSGATLAAVYAGRGFVLSDAGVIEVSLSGKTTAVVVARDAEWGAIAAVEVFGGNLYLLDREGDTILRHPGIEGGFGAKQRWFGEGVSADLGEVRDMAIDGDIWMLSGQGIMRFRRGSPEPFSISGLDTPLAEPVSLYTDEESERLYILDRGNRRVLVLDKGGEYREQYLWDRIESVSDLVVSEAEGKILLLSGSLVFELPLKGRT